MKYALMTGLVFITTIAKAQTISRLIAEARAHATSSGFSPQDSMHYYYSNDRGGDLDDIAADDMPGIKYDINRQWLYNSGVYESNQHDSQLFDSKDRVIAHVKQNRINNTWQYNFMHLYSYNLSGYIDTYNYLIYLPTGIDTFSRRIYTYDANGNIIVKRSMSRSAGQLQNSILDSFSFDGSNNLLWSKRYYYDTGSWIPNSYTAYTYNSGNKRIEEIMKGWIPDSNSWQNDYRKVATYNTNGQIASDTTFFWSQSTASWRANNLRTYNYTGTQLTSQEDWAFSGAWLRYYEEAYTYDSKGNITVVEQSDDVDNHRQLYEYNTFDQLTSHTTQKLQGATWENTFRRRYYYETFNAGVTEQHNSKIDLHVFPNPARDAVAIKVRLGKAQPVIITLLDAAGAPVRQWHQAAENHIDRSLQLTGVQPGVYLLRIKGYDVERTVRLTVQ